MEGNSVAQKVMACKNEHREQENDKAFPEILHSDAFYS